VLVFGGIHAAPQGVGSRPELCLKAHICSAICFVAIDFNFVQSLLPLLTFAMTRNVVKRMCAPSLGNSTLGKIFQDKPFDSSENCSENCS
jgi:hypothetical protein